MTVGELIAELRMLDGGLDVGLIEGITFRKLESVSQEWLNPDVPNAVDVFRKSREGSPVVVIIPVERASRRAVT